MVQLGNLSLIAILGRILFKLALSVVEHKYTIHS
jgi:hypothetical protein